MKKLSLFFLFLIAGYFILKQGALLGARKFIEYQWSKRFGTRLTIEKIDYSILAQSLTLLGITLKDSDRSLFDIRKIRVALDLKPLFQKNVAIRSIDVYKPNLFIFKEGKETNIGKAMVVMKEKQKKNRDVPQRKIASGIQKKAPLGGYSLSIQRIEVADLGITFVEQFKDGRFSYEIAHGQIELTHFSYPSPCNADLKMAMQFPKEGEFKLTGKLQGKSEKFKWHSQSELKRLSLVPLKDFFESQYSMTPRSGLVYLNSKMNVESSHLSSHHQMTLKEFEMEMNSLQGIATHVTTSLLKNPSQKDIAFDFRVNADLSSKSIDWFGLFAQAISESFFKRAAQLKPREIVEEAADDLLKEIEKAPSFPW